MHLSVHLLKINSRMLHKVVDGHFVVLLYVQRVKQQHNWTLYINLWTITKQITFNCKQTERENL